MTRTKKLTVLRTIYDSDPEAWTSSESPWAQFWTEPHFKGFYHKPQWTRENKLQEQGPDIDRINLSCQGNQSFHRARTNTRHLIQRTWPIWIILPSKWSRRQNLLRYYNNDTANNPTLQHWSRPYRTRFAMEMNSECTTRRIKTRTLWDGPTMGSMQDGSVSTYLRWDAEHS